MKESKENIVSIYEICPKVFESVLKFCYSGEITLDDVDVAHEFLRVADMMEMSEMTAKIGIELLRELNYTTLFQIWNIAGMIYKYAV